MIVGHGDIASWLKDRVDAILFASGVSDSLCTDEKEFKRESDMIYSFSLSKYTKTFFYFSSMSITYKDSAYTRHKLEMEKMVDMLYSNYYIIRLGNLTWGNNQKTFINYLRNQIRNDRPYEIKDELKFLIDKKTLVDVVHSLPLFNGKNTLSIFNEAMKVEDVVRKYILE
jgi:UDP-2-acetamido-2,6-beta-L-arabino-hexul-4-ose reductase